MKITPKLKEWLVENTDAEDSHDDVKLRKAAGAALMSGDLAHDVFSELSQPDTSDPAHAFAGDMKAMNDGIGKLVKLLAPASEGNDSGTAVADPPKTGDKATGTTTAPAGDGKGSDWLTKMVARMGGDGGGLEVRLKGAHEGYDAQRTAAMYPSTTKGGKQHPMAGRPIFDYGEGSGSRPIDERSELDKAVIGAFCKFLCAKASSSNSSTIAMMKLPDHDKGLMYYALEHYVWGGATDGGDTADIKGRRLTPGEQKAVIDDAASGGLEAAPIVFDDDVIQTPLLHGELFPFVKLRPLDRGRRIEGVATGTVTGTWGGVDDSQIALFNTAGYVTAFDTTIFRWEGAITIGLDFLSDTPIDFGAHISEQYGERLKEDLDDVIAAGNGSTQPEGIINKAGATSINFGGTTTLGNYESLRFGVAKPERGGGFSSSAVFCGTETSYQRARAIPVGATDARRLGGMDYNSYSWMEHPFKINESLTNAQIFHAILGRYRMYRRRGLTIRTSTEGDRLIRDNEMLMVALARYGGQQERGATIALTTTAPV